MVTSTVLVIFLAVVILALGAGALWMIKYRSTRHTRPGEQENYEPVQYTMQDMLKNQLKPFDFESENPAYLSMTPEEYETLSRQFEEVINSIGEGYQAMAYHKLEEFIEKISKADRETIAKGLALCIRAISNEKRPADMLELYDKLNAQGPGIRLIHVSGLGSELSAALMEALEQESRDMTWTKTSATKRAVFFKHDHPLVKSLQTDCRDRVIHELNHMGHDAYGAKWQDCTSINQALQILEKGL